MASVGLQHVQAIYSQAGHAPSLLYCINIVLYAGSSNIQCTLFSTIGI